MVFWNRYRFAAGEFQQCMGAIGKITAIQEKVKGNTASITLLNKALRNVKVESLTGLKVN